MISGTHQQDLGRMPAHQRIYAALKDCKFTAFLVLTLPLFRMNTGSNDKAYDFSSDVATSDYTAAPTFSTAIQSRLSVASSRCGMPDVRFVHKSARKARNIDILVFGDTNAGKKTFVESFVGRDTKNSRSKHSRS